MKRSTWKQWVATLMVALGLALSIGATPAHAGGNGADELCTDNRCQSQQRSHNYDWSD